MEAPQTWTATYRLQLNRDFTFDDVARVAPYLADLGVSHVYLSPTLQATPGSTHGYDGVDPTRLSDDLGGPEAYERMCDALERHGLRQLIDIVPNHLGTNDANPWWRDVLRRGADSTYARFFDLRWRGQPPRLRLPVLGSTLEEAVEQGALKVEATDEQEPVLRYYEASFPLAPESSDRASLTAAQRDAASLLQLVERQHYQLVPWQTAAHEIDYRRFFDINGLVGVCVEDESVFRETHALLLELVDAGKVDGLRVDHVDGLRDPGAYLARLHEAAPNARIYVEKILESDEALPDAWPVDGTTGYDFLVTLNRLFVDPANASELDRIYREFSGETRTYEEILAEKKRLALSQLMGGDIAHLADLLLAASPDAAAWATSEVETALRETIVALPVYRTYLRPAEGALSENDRLLLEETIDRAAEVCGSDVDASILQTVRDVLSLKLRNPAADDFVLAFQQVSGPAMAKGAEDTAFYCYNRLASLNEVGGDPALFGNTPEAFHAFVSRQAERWPRTMLATDTHDTKRGEDTRLRIDAISELPGEWSALVERWSAAHERYSRARPAGWSAFPSGPRLPDRNAEYLLYQSLAGAWPVDFDRAWEYMLKAAREAKLHTSWTAPDEEYESALRDFVEGVLSDEAFRKECDAFAQKLSQIATVSSLTQTLVKLTAPGVPDIYQGTELWQLALVDPDNRRPVDYQRRASMLERARHLSAAEALAGTAEGLPKLWLIAQVLLLRSQRPQLFDAPYAPLYATGPQRDSVLAFTRGDGMIIVGQRLHGRVQREGWRNATLDLPAGEWRNLFTDERWSGTIAVSNLLSGFPVALLLSEEGT